MTFYILLFIFLLFLSGVFSGSESALFSLSQGRRDAMRKSAKGNIYKRVMCILEWLKNPERTLTSILLMNLGVNMLISDVGDTLISDIFGTDPVNTAIISLPLITVILLLFGEIFPKITALNMAEKWSIRVQPFLRWSMFLTNPLAKPVYALARMINSYLPNSTSRFTEEELRDAITLAEEQGLLTEQEKDRLQGSIAFYHDTAYSAMIPRSNVFQIPHTFSPYKAKKAFIENKKTLALVYHEKDGRILGSLHVRNLIPAIYNRQKSFRNRIQDIRFLPETLSLRECLLSFTAQGDEFAAIHDESGEFIGLLTLKEILRRIMADSASVQSEANPDTHIQELGPSVYKVKGSILLDDLNAKINTNLQSENVETLSGFLLEELDGFPHTGFTFQYQNVIFYDMRVKNHRIETVSLRVKAK